MAALPYAAFWVFIISSSAIGDKLIGMNKFDKLSIRRVFNTLGMNSVVFKRKLYKHNSIETIIPGLIVPMGAVIGLSFVDCTQPYVGLGLLIIVSEKNVYYI